MKVLDNISELCSVLQGHTKKVFVVCGKTSYAKSGAKAQVQLVLKDEEMVIFNDYTENPKYEDALKGYKLFKSSGADTILAIGGGSSMDVGKLIKAIHLHKGDPDQIHTSYNPDEYKLRLITVPTTSGTGSETTHFAVMYKEGKKYSVAHQDLLPDVVILDSKLTHSMPSYLTACSGMDALSQAIESYWNVNSTEESIAYAREAIKLSLSYLEVAVNQPTDEARKAMMDAAYLAGKAINITKTTAPHALSYSLTSKYELPHGHAVAVFLVPFLEFNYNITEDDCNDARGHKFVQRRMAEIITSLGVDSLTEGLDILKRLIGDIGLEVELNKLGIEKDIIETICKEVNIQRLKNNPRKTFVSDIEQIVTSVY